MVKKKCVTNYTKTKHKWILISFNQHKSYIKYIYNIRNFFEQKKSWINFVKKFIHKDEWVQLEAIKVFEKFPSLATPFKVEFESLMYHRDGLINDSALEVISKNSDLASSFAEKIFPLRANISDGSTAPTPTIAIVIWSNISK